MNCCMQMSILMIEIMEDLKKRFWNWKDALKSKGLKDNTRIKKCCIFFVFFVFVHIYPPFRRKQIVSLCFGWDVRTRLGVAIYRSVWATALPHKGGHPVKCLAQKQNKRTCRLVLHNLS